MTEDSGPGEVVVSILPDGHQRYAQISPFLLFTYKFRNIEELYKNNCDSEL
jgi:hypothetical protein